MLGGAGWGAVPGLQRRQEEAGAEEEEGVRRAGREEVRSGAGTGQSPRGHTRGLRAEEGGFSLLQGGGGPGDPATPSYDLTLALMTGSPSASRPFPSDPGPQGPRGSYGRIQLNSFSDPSGNTVGGSSRRRPTGATPAQGPGSWLSRALRNP